MCITIAPAELRGTQLYAGEGEVDGKVVHVLAYQNQAESAGPNAMILPIPAAVMPDERNVIDTRTFASFLGDIHRATEFEGEVCRGGRWRAAAKVFDVGSYTVVLAKTARAISDALHLVPDDKRPAAGLRLIESFEELYPGWPLAICCWNGKVEAEPLLWWFEPKFPDHLFAPALDAHDGGPPDLDAKVKVDHFVAFGSSISRVGQNVHYSHKGPIPPDAQKLLPLAVSGTKIQASLPNGDFWRSTKSLTGPAVRRAPGSHAPAMDIHLGGWNRNQENGYWAAK